MYIVWFVLAGLAAIAAGALVYLDRRRAAPVHAHADEGRREWAHARGYAYSEQAPGLIGGWSRGAFAGADRLLAVDVADGSLQGDRMFVLDLVPEPRAEQRADTGAEQTPEDGPGPDARTEAGSAARQTAQPAPQEAAGEPADEPAGGAHRGADRPGGAEAGTVVALQRPIGSPVFFDLRSDPAPVPREEGAGILGAVGEFCAFSNDLDVARRVCDRRMVAFAEAVPSPIRMLWSEQDWTFAELAADAGPGDWDDAIAALARFTDLLRVLPPDRSRGPAMQTAHDPGGPRP